MSVISFDSRSMEKAPGARRGDTLFDTDNKVKQRAGEKPGPPKERSKNGTPTANVLICQRDKIN